MSDSVDEPPRTSRFVAAAVVLAVSVMLSRVLGFVREAVLANRVGAGVEMDAYRTAFQIPDLLNYFLAGGALSIAFIPMYARVRGRDRMVCWDGRLKVIGNSILDMQGINRFLKQRNK